MARERALDPSSALAKTALVLIGVLLALPIVLIASTMVVLEGRLSPSAAGAPGAAVPPQSARSYSMIVHEADRTIRLWLEDLDGQPSFRQTIEVGGQTVSDQIYRGDERTLYTGEADAGSEMVWSSVADVTADDLRLESLAVGPGAWALEYGVGEHEVEVGGTTLDITVLSVEEDLPAEAFELPSGALPEPAE